jgi:hydroxymethylpyrimidine pyrophosphatase-like HAD family hydrolase
MYKVVFFDVDGTLLSEIDRSIPLSTKEAIGKLIARGIKVVVATGRPYNLLTVLLLNVMMTLSIKQCFQQKPCEISRILPS